MAGARWYGARLLAAAMHSDVTLSTIAAFRSVFNARDIASGGASAASGAEPDDGGARRHTATWRRSKHKHCCCAGEAAAAAGCRCCHCLGAAWRWQLRQCSCVPVPCRRGCHLVGVVDGALGARHEQAYTTEPCLLLTFGCLQRRLPTWRRTQRQTCRRTAGQCVFAPCSRRVCLRQPRLATRCLQ